MKPARAFIFVAAVAIFLAMGFRAGEDVVVRPSEDPDLGAPAPVVGSDLNVPTEGFLRRDWTLPPTIGARSTLVADLGNGERFLRVRADAEWPIASLTKLMTAAVVLERFDLSERIVIEQSDIDLGRNASLSVISPGEKYSVRDLLTLLLVASSNEAAEAFARLYGRTEFVAGMNAKAAEWGLASTRFADPSGISADNRATADDLLKLIMTLNSRYPDILALSRSATVSVVDENSGRVKTAPSTHKFAGRPDFLGGKTGTTRQAGENLVSIFSYGRPLVIIVLGDENRFGNTERLFQWFTHDFGPGN